MAPSLGLFPLLHHGMCCGIVHAGSLGHAGGWQSWPSSIICTCVVTTPQRTVEVHNVLREELWRHVRILGHHGKTRIWNRGCSSLTGKTNWKQQHRRQIPQQEFGGAAMRTGQRIKASPFWDLQWGDKNLLNQNSRRFWPTTGSYSQGSLKFKTCSARVCCCSSELVHPHHLTRVVNRIFPEAR